MNTLIIASCQNEKSSRHGLTLMEILASVFILAFGLMAVITVLPFAVKQIERLNVADISGACGRGAVQQIRIAEWHKPENIWVGQDFSGLFPAYDFSGQNSGSEECVLAEPFIVDPLGLLGSVYNYMDDGAEMTGREFPMRVKQSSNDRDTLHVMSLVDYHGNQQNGLQKFDKDKAESFFRWNDDMVFAQDTQSDSGRPVLVENSTTKKPLASGEFSWLYMVTPRLGHMKFADGKLAVKRQGMDVGISDIAYTLSNNIDEYIISVVVFHRRDLYPEPLEMKLGENQYRPIRKLGTRTADNTLNATGANIMLLSENEEDLDMSSIKWILLTGRSQELHDTYNSGANGTLCAMWYRVSGYDDIQSDDDGYFRRVFLVGPDWPGAKTSSANPKDPPVYAILCDGVVQVFHDTITNY